MIMYSANSAKKMLQQPIFREFFAFGVVGMCFFLQGFSLTYNAFIKVGKDGVTATQASISGSISFVMMFFATIFNTWLMNKFGRKITIQFVFIAYMLAGVTFSFYDENKTYLFYIGRIFSGIGNSSIPVTMLYLSEVCRKSHRGTFGGSMAALVTTGSLTSYILQYNFQLRMVGLVSGTLVTISFLASFFIPETKYWYAIENRLKEAEESSLWFDSTQTENEVYVELQNIRDERTNSECVFIYLCKWQHLKRFLITQILMFSRALCGRIPIVVFPEYYFSSFHLEFDAAKLAVLAIILEFLVSLMASFIIGKFNRRTTLFYCLLISLPTLCLMMFSNGFVKQLNEICPWLELIFVYLYSAIVVAFINPLVNLMVVETVSESNKNRASLFSFSMSSLTIYMAINAFSFPFLLENFGIIMPLLCFLCGNYVILIMVVFFVPETHDKALYECAIVKSATTSDSEA